MPLNFKNLEQLHPELLVQLNDSVLELPLIGLPIKNALQSDLYRAIEQCLNQPDYDRSVKVVILWDAGADFTHRVAPPDAQPG